MYYSNCGDDDDNEMRMFVKSEFLISSVDIIDITSHPIYITNCIISTHEVMVEDALV